MQIDFSQVDTSVVDRMALFFVYLAAGCIVLPFIVGWMLKIIRMPFFIIRILVVCTSLGWFYYWATSILAKF